MKLHNLVAGLGVVVLLLGCTLLGMAWLFGLPEVIFDAGLVAVVLGAFGFFVGGFNWQSPPDA